MFLAMMMAGCADDDATSGPESEATTTTTAWTGRAATSENVAGLTFLVTATAEGGKDYALVATEDPALVTFEGDRIDVSDGCNGTNAVYRIDGDGHLELSDGTAGNIRCADAVQEQANRMTRSVQSGATLSILGDELHITNGDYEVRLRQGDRPPPR